MKHIFLAILIFCLSVSGIQTTAQTLIPKGKVKLFEFNNTKAQFTVPEGKSWYIINVFAAAGITPTYICLKSINGSNLASDNISRFILYDSNKVKSFQFPIVFPANTIFELEIMRADLVGFQPANRTAFLNIIETDD